MPSELKRGARCPNCQEPLIVVVWTRSGQSVTAEYFHKAAEPGGRARRRCVVDMTVEQERKVRKAIHA